MKLSLRMRRHHLPTVAALIGAAIGSFLFTLIPDGILGTALPIPTLQKGEIFKTVLAVFGKEALPLGFAILAFFITRHPLPIVLDTAWRGFALFLSSLYLGRNYGIALSLLYFALHTAAVLSHIAAGIAALSYEKKSGVFPILYFVGLLFLLTVIRLLAFTLIL